jgi:hypothetical protein
VVVVVVVVVVGDGVRWRGMPVMPSLCAGVGGIVVAD